MFFFLHCNILLLQRFETKTVPFLIALPLSLELDLKTIKTCLRVYQNILINYVLDYKLKVNEA